MSSFRVQVGPTRISVHQGRTVLVCEPGGMIPAHSEKGLHFNDTRIISSWSLFAGGQNWDLLSGGVISHDALQTHLTNRKLDTASGPVAARTLWLVLGRSIHGGMTSRCAFLPVPGRGRLQQCRCDHRQTQAMRISA